MVKKIFCHLIVAAMLLAWPARAMAQGDIPLIRDAEIESIIRAWSTPIFEAAGLNAADVSVHIVAVDQMNAFVAGGQRMFVFTGLLMAAQSPNQVIGVIAHEAGHITGGHLARSHEAMRNAQTQAIVATLLGIAAMAAGSGDAGAAVLSGGQHVAERSLLQYSRTQESAADQAGLTFLEKTGQSGRGILEFLEVLGDQEALLVERQDPYVRTHPISTDRIAAMRRRVESSRYTDAADAPEDLALMARMQAKLVGFIQPKAKVYRRFPENDNSAPARYARSIALYRNAETEAALTLLGGLIREAPDDPYYQELAGQILFESGRVAQALGPYRRAVELAPREDLIRFGLARVQVATEDPTLNREAIGHLEHVVRNDPQEMPGAWRELAVAYGRDGQMGLSHLATAEFRFLTGDREGAREQAKRAMGKLPEGTPAWLRAQDIENATKKPKNRGLFAQ